MGYVQRSTTDEGSGGAVLFLLKDSLLHHQAEHSIRREQAERNYGTGQVNKVNKGLWWHNVIT